MSASIRDLRAVRLAEGDRNEPTQWKSEVKIEVSTISIGKLFIPLDTADVDTYISRGLF
ncbi:MAG TPA: hypothetical protein VMR02_07005 [Terracidiphilus sp.]|jgi:hypothetical protein|nr:hypothetical protein [Terracidiphilus sp.]